VQWTDLIICKTRRNSVIHQGMVYAFIIHLFFFQLNYSVNLFDWKFWNYTGLFVILLIAAYVHVRKPDIVVLGPNFCLGHDPHCPPYSVSRVG